MKKNVTLLTLGLCLAALGALAQQNTMDEPWEKRIHITQGPSVIEETGTAATLTWTTDRPAANHVRYRSGQGPWKSIHEPGGSTEHAMHLTGLQPGRHVEWEILTRDGDVRSRGHFRARAEAVAYGPPHHRDGYTMHVPIYRADHPQTGQHLYSADPDEIARVEKQGWKSVGMVGYVAATQEPGYIAVYRIYVPNGDHFYTTSLEERNTIISQGAQDEGVVGYIASSQRPGTFALHRMVSTRNGMHFYSANAGEVAEATKHQGYRDEGVMGFVWLE